MTTKNKTAPERDAVPKRKAEQIKSSNADYTTFADSKQSSLIVTMTVAEAIGAIYQLGGSLENRNDKLIVKNVTTIPDNIRAAIIAHKSTIMKLVSAFGDRWPTGDES